MTGNPDNRRRRFLTLFHKPYYRKYVKQYFQFVLLTIRSMRNINLRKTIMDLSIIFQNSFELSFLHFPPERRCASLSSFTTKFKK